MIVATAGAAYIDIDAYASIIAYAELLNLQGEHAIASSTAPLNASVTDSLRRLGKNLSLYKKGDKDQFVVIDTSNERFFDPVVKNGVIVEVIDHHPGHEQYWNDKLGSKAQIEHVGAACTQIVERWQKAELLEQMDKATAALLAAGILDNTLNFTAAVTTDRDRAAFNALEQQAKLPSTFAADYFSECEAAIDADLENAIKNDLKEITETELIPRYFGQLVVWNGHRILQKDKAIMAGVLAEYGEDWGLNLISISENRSYFLAENPDAQAKLTSLFDVAFSGGVSTPHTMMLRKEILRTALNRIVAR